MFLDKIAQQHFTEKFEIYDEETEKFVASDFVGRIGPTDRFLSIYNRPTRKRQLYVSPEQEIPPSLVIRHALTGAEYILGIGRMDARGDVDEGNPYVTLCMLHDVSSTGSGRARLYRRAPLGPPENPGWLVEQELAHTFLDLEFRTNASESGTLNNKIPNFYAWCPATISAQEWDYFELGGKRYRVVDSFMDAGMVGLRLDQEPDPRLDFVIQTKEQVYDNIRHEWVDRLETYNVTGIIPRDEDISKWARTTAINTIDVVIKSEHIGFTPLPEMDILYQGRTRKIKNVTTQAGQKEFRLVCE